jgi:hypothetical protein
MFQLVRESHGHSAGRHVRRGPRRQGARAENEIGDTIEAIYKELEVQMKRMGQIQQQVDELGWKKRLTEP